MDYSTVGSLLRSAQAFCGQLCDKETLDHGIIYSCPRYPALPEANQIREVIVDPPKQLPQRFEETEDWFRWRDLFCYRWAPAEGVASKDLRSFLTHHGFRERRLSAMRLVHWPALTPIARWRIIPARAMRQAYDSSLLALTPAEECSDPRMAADAYLERLDDPQYDAFLALDSETREQQPAGRCTLYQVGDIARVMDWTVNPDFADRDANEALLIHVLILAKRLMMRMICTQIDVNDAVRRELLARLGFVADGEIVEFERSRS